MNQVDRDMTAPLNDELGNFQQSIWTIHWDSMTQEISRDVGLLLLLLESWITIVMFILTWKQECSSMWRNNGCKKLDNDEILQDRKKHEKKYSQLWHPPNDFHMQSRSPFCIIAPHELLPRTWWTHHARGPPVVQEDQLSNILEKKGKTQAKNEHPMTYLSELMGDCSPFHLDFSLSQWTWQPQSTTASMAHGSLQSPWLTQLIRLMEAVHGQWQDQEEAMTAMIALDGRYGGVAAAVPPVTDSLFAFKMTRWGQGHEWQIVRKLCFVIQEWYTHKRCHCYRCWLCFKGLFQRICFINVHHFRQCPSFQTDSCTDVRWLKFSIKKSHAMRLFEQCWQHENLDPEKHLKLTNGNLRTKTSGDGILRIKIQRRYRYTEYFSSETPFKRIILWCLSDFNCLFVTFNWPVSHLWLHHKNPTATGTVKDTKHMLPVPVPTDQIFH